MPPEPHSTRPAQRPTTSRTTRRFQLVRNGRIQYFDDRELEPGDPWYKKIADAIDHARVAVLLVSPKFFASRFIADDELPRIVRAVDDGLTILWIPLSGKLYGPDAIPGSEKLAGRQAVWDASQPLDSLPEESRTGRLLDLCRRINAHMVTRVPFNIPFGSLGDLLKGREQELQRLDEQLKLRGASATLQPRAISGLGGIGKTRLAIEYAHRHRDEFTALLFVSANTPADLEANLARLCADDKALDLPEFRRAPQAEQYAAAVRWLNQNTGWLLILDNVDTEEALEAVQNLAASLHGGHVLITSRLTGWGGSVRVIPLDVIPLGDAVALLLQKANEGGRKPRPDDAEKARVLAIELGCLPLSLTHAGAYVRWGNKSFDRYLSEFDKALSFNKAGMIEYDPDSNTDRAAKTVATTYFLSIDLLGPPEKSLVRAASILSPAPIPIAMFAECPDEFKTLVELWCNESGDAMVERDVEDALSELANYSLVERGDSDFSIHRTERLVLSHRIPKGSFPKWVEATRAALEKYAPDETAENPKTWPVWDKLRPHAEALVAAQKEHDGTSPSIPLLIALGQFYFGKGLYNENLAVDEAALALAEQTEGAESESFAGRLLAYGETLREIGRYADAEAAFRRSVAINEKYGSDSTEVADGLNYVAITVGSQGRLQEEEELLRRALAIYESKTDPSQDGLGKILANLGVIELNQGRLSEAEEHAQRAQSAWEASLGPKHQRTIGAMCLRAHIMANRGHSEEAISLHRRAVQLFEEVLPPDHPAKLTGIVNLARLLQKAGEYAEAETLFRRALEARTRVMGEEHPATLDSVGDLAGLLDERGESAEAERLFRSAMDLQDRQGLKTPNTLITINNLAALLQRAGRYAEAESLYRRALAGLKRTAGEDDPRTLSCEDNLASLLEQAGRNEEALDMRLDALARRRGLDQSQVDPRLTVDINNLGLAYRKLGRFDKAESLAREALELDRRRGPNSPIIPHRLNNLASILLLRGSMQEARGILAEAWALEEGKTDLTSSRIAFMRQAAAMLDDEPAGACIGHLKTLLAIDPLPDHANVAKIWDIDYFICYLRPKLSEEQTQLLTALAAAMNDRTKLPALGIFAQWNTQPAVPLDTPCLGGTE